MKNKALILLIFALPIAIFALLQSFAVSRNFEEGADNKIAYDKGRIIKFYSPMCSECKTVAKNVENVLKNYEDEIILEEIDVTENTTKNKRLINSYKVTVVPTVIFLDKNGKVHNKTEGEIEEFEIINHVEKIK